MSKTTSPKTSYSVSEARDNLYTIVKDAVAGLNYEITQRDGKSAVVLGKEEYDGLMETLDIMSNPDEYKEILEAIHDPDPTLIPAEKVWKELGLDAD